jgi:hypothetical protein
LLQGGGFTVDAELAMKRLEAEAAHARKAAAQTEATYKMERADWITSLDNQKFEVRIAAQIKPFLQQQSGGTLFVMGCCFSRAEQIRY